MVNPERHFHLVNRRSNIYLMPTPCDGNRMPQAQASHEQPERITKTTNNDWKHLLVASSSSLANTINIVLLSSIRRTHASVLLFLLQFLLPESSRLVQRWQLLKTLSTSVATIGKR